MSCHLLRWQSCKHFGWGFIPYWKEFAEKYMVKKSPCINDVQPSLEKLPTVDQVNTGSDDSNLGSQSMKANKIREFEMTKCSAIPLLHKAGSNHTLVTGDQPNSGIPAINLGSKGKEDDNNHKTKQKAKRSKLSDVPLLQKTDSPIIGYENISSISHGIDGAPSIEDRTTEDVPVNCMNSINSFGEEVDTFAFTDKDMDYSEIRESVRNLTACHLYTQSRSSISDDGLHKVQSDKDAHSSENIIIHTKRRQETSSDSRLNKKHEQSGVLGSEANLSELNPVSVKENSEKPPESLNQVKDRRKVKTKGKTQKKANSKATKSLRTCVSTDNEGLRGAELDKDMPKRPVGRPKKQKNDMPANGFCESEDVSSKDNFKLATPASVNRQRKLEFETLDGENKKVSFDSPQSSSFKRSRSGRPQMRPMEFWRNQIPIYSLDRTLTAVEEGNARQPETGRMSAHKRKKRKLL